MPDQISSEPVPSVNQPEPTPQTPSVKKSRGVIVALIIILVSLLSSAGYFGYKYWQAKKQVQETQLTERAQVTQSEKAADPDLVTEVNKGRYYANLELSLIDEKNNITDPRSLIFGIQINNFHPDWNCYSLGYNQNGFEINCQQKACKISETIKWPSVLNPDQQKVCYDELANREYPLSFNNLTIEASEYEPTKEIADFSNIIDENSLQTTSKGTPYEFIKTEVDKYVNSYSAVFYSPFELTKKLSKKTGTFYGSDWIYGKYTIKTNTDASEDMVIRLFESIIDSTIFIQPNDSFD